MLLEPVKDSSVDFVVVYADEQATDGRVPELSLIRGCHGSARRPFEGDCSVFFGGGPVTASVGRHRMMTADTRPWRFILTSCSLVATLAFSVTIGIQSIYRSWKIGQLVSQLASDVDSERRSAMQALVARNVDVTPHLIRVLRHENVDVREFAAQALSQEIPIPDEIVDAFIVVATDETQEERIRWWACYTFARIGQQSQGPATETETNVINALTTVLNSSDDNVVAFAASALREFGPGAASAESDLRRVLNTGSDISRVHVAGALLALRPSAHSAVLPVLLEVVQGNDNVAGRWALHFMGMLGSDAKSVIPTLEVVVHTNPDLSYDVGEAIKSIQSEGCNAGCHGRFVRPCFDITFPAPFLQFLE